MIPSNLMARPAASVRDRPGRGGGCRVGSTAWRYLLGTCLSCVLLTSGVATARAEVPPPNYMVAFIGDQSLSSNARAVLQMIEDEGAEAVVHAGDFDYDDDPEAWDDMLNDILGPNFPYFASVGNHDHGDFYGSGGYQEYLEARMNRIGASWEGDLGVMSWHRWSGLSIVLVAPDEFGQGDGIHDVYIRDQFALDDSIWRVATWHKNMNKMQVGGKPNETGWGVYEESRKAGAIIHTGHEHVYCRTHLMSDMDDQVIASTDNTLVLAADDTTTGIDEGRSFAFVSGLAGKSIRDQERDDDWFAAIYTEDQDAEYGALFGVFNYLGDERLAYFYFKDINGFIVDEFFVETSLLQTTSTTLSTTTTTIPTSGIMVEQVSTGTSSSSALVATDDDLTAMNQNVYLVAVSSKPNADVIAVDGLDVAWSELVQQCAGRDQTGVSVWMSNGSARIDGPVTATFDGPPSNAVITVTRYSGIDLAAPVSGLASANTNGSVGACTGGQDGQSYVMPLTTADPNSMVYSAAAMRNQTHSPGSGFTERAEVVSGTAGTAASLATSDRTVALAAPINATGSFNAPVDWAAAALVLRPAGVTTTTTSTTTTTLDVPTPGDFETRTLRVSALNKPPGDQRWTLKSDEVNTAGVSHDPSNEVVTLVFTDGATTLMEATIPAGDPGWSVAGTRYRWKAKSGSHPNGLTRLTIKDNGGVLKMSARAKDVQVTGMLGQPAVTVTMVIGDDLWTGPTPPCSTTGNANVLKCR